MNTIADKLRQSWELFQRSIIVIREHPKLLLFPLVTGLLTLWIALFFLAPLALVLLAPHWVEGSRIQSFADSIIFLRFNHGFDFHVQPVGTAILAGFYLLDMFLASMGSVAFNSEIIEALHGRPVSIRHGLEAAFARWQAVLFWSLAAGIVGLVIRHLEEKLNFIGQWIVGLIGTAWSVASIFAVPILVREPSLKNPIQVLSRSAATIKKTWGQMLLGYLGMQGTNVLFLWTTIFYLGASAAVAAYVGWWIMWVAGVIWILSLIAYSYLASVASRVYLCALYLFAADGLVTGPYDQAMLARGLTPKKA